MEPNSFKRRSLGTFLFSLLFIVHTGILIWLMKRTSFDPKTFEYIIKLNRKAAAPFVVLTAASLFTLVDLLVIISPVYCKHYSLIGFLLGIFTGVGTGLGLDLKGGVSWTRDPQFLILWSLEAVMSVALLCYRLWKPFVPFNEARPEWLPELNSVCISPPNYYSPYEVPTLTTLPNLLSRPVTPVKTPIKAKPKTTSITSPPYPTNPQFFNPSPSSMINNY